MITKDKQRISELETLIPLAWQKLGDISPHDVCELSETELKFYHLSLEYYERTGKAYNLGKILTPSYQQGIK